MARIITGNQNAPKWTIFLAIGAYLGLAALIGVICNAV